MKTSLIAAVLSLALWGCGGNDDPEPPTRTSTPAIHPSTLSVEEWETARATVTDANTVTLIENSRPDLFVAVADGVEIAVTGLAPGEGVVRVLADDARLSFKVIVTAKNVDDRYDFTPELADTRTRFTSDRVNIIYDDNPGVIVSRQSNGRVEMRDLGSGDNISFDPSGDTEGTLEEATLTINGVATPLESCTLQRRCENGDRWYSMRRRGSESHAVLVVTSL